MNKQTAVQWLIDHIKNPDGLPYNTPEELFEMALQMEKQQIMDAYDKVSMSTPEQYYTETYKSE